MDYKFHRDLYGNYQAKFSMGHEALGLWLTEELGVNKELLTTLLKTVDQLQNQQRWEHYQAGNEFMLSMTSEGIEVRAAILDDLRDIAPEELNHYDEESQASCGLEDFRQLLEAWCEFIKAAD